MSEYLTARLFIVVMSNSKLIRMKYLQLPLCLCQKVPAFLVFFVLFSFSLHVPAVAEEYEETAYIKASAGQIGVLDNLASDTFGLEYLFTPFTVPYDLRLSPVVGALSASNGSYYIYAGLAYDYYFNNQWLLVPSFAVGMFQQSDEVDLGNDLEFKSGIELAYQFGNKVRVATGLFHLSNAGISDSNSGTEVFQFSVSIPLGGSMNDG